MRSWDNHCMTIAEMVGFRATCTKRNVGCVIVNEFGHIKATGFNGVPRGYPHCIDSQCGDNPCLAVHAEINALLQCDDVQKIDTIYITLAPCVSCAKAIANTSCKRVVYNETYKDTTGLVLLAKVGIECEQLTIK